VEGSAGEGDSQRLADVEEGINRAHKVSDTLQLIVKTKRINTFNTLAGRFCL